MTAAVMGQTSLKLFLTIPFLNEREANIAYDVLRVDKEPPRSLLSKSLDVNKNVLNVSFSAPTAQQLRVGVNGFMDQVTLVCETLESFGPPQSEVYSHY